jgi:hypothetical protein
MAKWLAIDGSEDAVGLVGVMGSWLPVYMMVFWCSIGQYH